MAGGSLADGTVGVASARPAVISNARIIGRLPTQSLRPAAFFEDVPVALVPGDVLDHLADPPALIRANQPVVVVADHDLHRAIADVGQVGGQLGLSPQSGPVAVLVHDGFVPNLFAGPPAGGVSGLHGDGWPVTPSAFVSSIGTLQPMDATSNRGCFWKQGHCCPTPGVDYLG